jgi:CheY-like chemotaxis protein
MEPTAKTTLPITVLLIDDDDVAVEGVIRSMQKHKVQCTTVTADDGQEALDILRHKHPSKKITSPFLVLLDLNMPRMDGFQFLEAVRADPALQNMVIFVLTTSSRDSDRMRAYQENVAGYMVKSAVGPQFGKLMALLDCYGQSVVLPNL